MLQHTLSHTHHPPHARRYMIAGMYPSVINKLNINTMTKQVLTLSEEQQEALTAIWEYLEETGQHLDKDNSLNATGEYMGILRPLLLN